MIDRYDKAFMSMALDVARLSKDPSTKVGCILVDNSRRQIAMGFNGFPPSIYDDGAVLDGKARMGITGRACPYGNMSKYDLVIHAELNAIINSTFDGHTLYCTHIPCKDCAKHIVAAGIKRVVHADQIGATDMGYELSFDIMEVGGILCEHICLS